MIEMVEEEKNCFTKTNTYSLFTITYYLKHGGVAQLGEHLPCKQGVRSSILLISTSHESDHSIEVVPWKLNNVKQTMIEKRTRSFADAKQTPIIELSVIVKS